MYRVVRWFGRLLLVVVASFDFCAVNDFVFCEALVSRASLWFIRPFLWVVECFICCGVQDFMCDETFVFWSVATCFKCGGFTGFIRYRQPLTGDNRRTI